MSDCINLREQFGETFRIFFDPAYDPKHRPRATLDPWMMTLRGAGKGVELYPAGGSLVRVDLDRHNPTAAKLLEIDGVELVQDGDHEKTIEFDVSLFDQVDEVLKFRRKRRLSDEHKAKLLAAGRQFESSVNESNQRQPQIRNATQSSS